MRQLARGARQRERTTQIDDCNVTQHFLKQDAGLDVVDAGHIPLEGAESTDSVLRASSAAARASTSSQLPGSRCKRRESVARMTWDGLAYLATAVVRWRTAGAGDEAASVRSRSVSTPRTAEALLVNGTGAAAPRSAALPPDVTMDTPAGAADSALDDEVFFDSPPPPYEDVVDAPPTSAGHPATAAATAIRTSPDVRYEIYLRNFVLILNLARS